MSGMQILQTGRINRMEAFMELFGEYEILGLTVYKWGLLIVALIFVWKT